MEGPTKRHNPWPEAPKGLALSFVLAYGLALFVSLARLKKLPKLSVQSGIKCFFSGLAFTKGSEWEASFLAQKV